MTFPSCRRTALAVMVLLTAIVAVISPSVAVAQAPPGGAGQVPPATPTETADDGVGDCLRIANPLRPHNLQDGGVPFGEASRKLV